LIGKHCHSKATKIMNFQHVLNVFESLSTKWTSLKTESFQFLISRVWMKLSCRIRFVIHHSLESSHFWLQKSKEMKQRIGIGSRLDEFKSSSRNVWKGFCDSCERLRLQSFRFIRLKMIYLLKQSPSSDVLTGIPVFSAVNSSTILTNFDNLDEFACV
jgi:hypothetical protein